MTEHSLLLSSPPGDVDDVHGFLEGVWSSNPGVVPTDRMAFETAVIELASNVIQHADDGGGVTWHLTVTCSPESLTATLYDGGVSADLSLHDRSLPDPLSESGRGLAFVQMLVDTLDYRNSERGNEWSISKRRSDTHD
ncbi:ATP-binding protein [Labedella phragmitis]|uniref:ATP-binding protein n=1 Tax=Labedella phragmitis TaxID=2498849 RepID=A0A444PZ16_9MICO|nr:ATP-binding protein [Labedella phragmitis]RWZ53134.1 ATP-binding protein [Labedella phragmitis]